MRTIVALLFAAATARAARMVGTADELYQAIDDGKRHIQLTADIDLPKKESVIINYEVTINGDGHTITARDHSVFVVSGEDAHLDLIYAEVTVSGHKAEGCIRVDDGAELEAYFVTFQDCENNMEEGAGGGIAASDGASSIVAGVCTFVGCTAREGGGIASMADITFILQSVLDSNVARGRHGSALVANKLGSLVVVHESSFRENIDDARSTIYISGAEGVSFEDTKVEVNDNKGAGVVVLAKIKGAEFKRCDFVGNKNRAIRMFQLPVGGGIEFRNCLFQDNEDTYVDDKSPGGAAIFAKESSPDSGMLIKDCTFERNVARYDGKMSQGGALWLGVDAKISSAYFGDNEADEGGAIYIAENVRGVTIKDVDFSGNHATTAGGAIAVVATSSTATFPGQLKLKGLTAESGPAGVVDAAEGPKTGGELLKMNGGSLVMEDTQMDEIEFGLRYAKAKLDFTDYSGTADVYLADDAKLSVIDCGAASFSSMSGEIDAPFKGYNDDGFFNIKCD